MKIIGLDISTSIVGVCIFDTEVNKEIFLDHIDLTKLLTPWSKADKVLDYLKKNLLLSPEWKNIEKLSIEDPAKKFAQGRSSAQVISSLARFNGIISYISRQVLGLEPTFIAPSMARKKFGMKLTPTKKDPMLRNQKQQVFDFITSTDFSEICKAWPRKKTGAYKDHCFDLVDAYVVAKAAS